MIITLKLNVIYPLPIYHYILTGWSREKVCKISYGKRSLVCIDREKRWYWVGILMEIVEHFKW